MKEIKDDMKFLRHMCMGGKSEWNPDGSFKIILPNTHIYVYRHRQHASCSSVLLSLLQTSDWCFDKKWEGLDNLQCDHANHHHLLPYFHDNRFLKLHYTRLVNEGESDVQLLLDELNDIEQKLENAVEFNESEFWHPMSLVNNWDENDWSKRLQVGIKKTFQIHAVYTARNTFKDYLRVMNVVNLDKCFLFRGFPDILLQKKGAVIVGSQAAAVADDITNPNPNRQPSNSESSNDEDSIVENSWQRNPLKGADGDDLPEKLGEMLTGLYILLVSKILRRIRKGKNIHLQFQVKGVLLDKTAANVLCTMSIDFQQSVSVPKIHITDYMGSILTPQSLCYLIQAVINKDSSSRQHSIV